MYVLFCLKDNFRLFVYSAIKSKPEVTKLKFKFYCIRKKKLTYLCKILIKSNPIPIFCQKVWHACFMKCLQNEADTRDYLHDKIKLQISF